MEEEDITEEEHLGVLLRTEEEHLGVLLAEEHHGNMKLEAFATLSQRRMGVPLGGPAAPAAYCALLRATSDMYLQQTMGIYPITISDCSVGLHWVQRGQARRLGTALGELWGSSGSFSSLGDVDELMRRVILPRSTTSTPVAAPPRLPAGFILFDQLIAALESTSRRSAYSSAGATLPAGSGKEIYRCPRGPWDSRPPQRRRQHGPNFDSPLGHNAGGIANNLASWWERWGNNAYSPRK